VGTALPGRSDSPAAASSSGQHGRIVITGGLGVLGLLIASWLTQQGRADLVLLSRSAHAGGGGHPQLVELLAAQSGSRIGIHAADMGCQSDVAAEFGAAAAEAPLLAVLHAGGVLADATAINMPLVAVRRVLAPKLAALSSWTRAAALQPATSQVLFSSVAALLGSPGQANYAAANAALDAAAQALQAQGVAAISVQWGAWAGAGMAAQDAQTAARVERMGMAMIQPQSGLAALAAALQLTAAPLGQLASAPTLSAVPFLWDRMDARFRQLQQAVPLLFSECYTPSAAAAAAPAAAGVPSAEGAAGRASMLADVRQAVLDTVASILGKEVGGLGLQACIVAADGAD